MPFIFLAFVITPILELWLILKVGSAIGVGFTILLILLTAAIGTMLLRQQGFSTLFRARQKISDGEIPAKELIEGLMLAFAGALMLTPGFVTDCLGFLLLLPPTRALIIHHFKANIILAASGGQYRYQESGSDGDVIIEGEFRREENGEDFKKLH